MRRLSHTKSIFGQLRDTDGATGVKTIIENHDAWVHNDEVRAEITAALRARVGGQWRGDATMARIEAQRAKLASVVTRLQVRVGAAG